MVPLDVMLTQQIPLIILASARKQSETKSYVDFVFDGTNHKLVDVLNYNISFYNYDGIYPSTDNFNLLVEEMLNSNTIIFATPVYWYSMSGLMKNVFDRFTDLVTIKKETGRKIKGKNVFLLSVGSDQNLPDGFEIPFRMTSDYLEMNYKGCVYFSTDNKISHQDKSNMKQIFMDKIKEVR